MGRVVNLTPRPNYPQERPGTFSVGGCVGTGAGLDGREKISPTPGFDPRTAHPVACRYSYYAERFNMQIPFLVCVLLFGGCRSVFFSVFCIFCAMFSGNV